MVDHTSCIAHASTTYNFLGSIFEIYVLFILSGYGGT